MKANDLKWSSIDGKSWRASTENGLIGMIELDEKAGRPDHYILYVNNGTENLEVYYEVFTRQAAEKCFLERAGLA